MSDTLDRLDKSLEKIRFLVYKWLSFCAGLRVLPPGGGDFKN
jgi:hypothetical protein